MYFKSTIKATRNVCFYCLALFAKSCKLELERFQQKTTLNDKRVSKLLSEIL